MTWEGFFFVLANISAIVGLLTAGIAGYGGYRLWRLSRRYRQWIDAKARQVDGVQVAIAVGIGGAITAEVEHIVGSTMKVYPISHEGTLTPQDAFKVRDEFVALKNWLIANVGPTQVHFFYRGPVYFAAICGAILDNWVPAMIYDHVKDGPKSYVAVMPLDKNMKIAKSAIKAIQ